jgi:hypothetical protein
VARAGSFFAEHPDDDRLRIMAPHKSNLAEKPPSLSYRIVSSAEHNTARVEWRGVTDHDANSLAAGSVSPHERTALGDAKGSKGIWSAHRTSADLIAGAPISEFAHED